MRRPSSGLARRRRDARDYLHHLEQRATATHNPVFAWRAYTAARVGGLAVPEWVLDYFDRAASNVNALSQPGAVPGEGKIAPAIAAALGFTRRGKGRFNALADAVIPDPALELAAQVALLRMVGHKLYVAYENIATARGVSRSTVAAAWTKYGGDAAWGVSEK